MINKSELILDRVRSLVTHDIETGQLLFRLTSLEDPSLNCTAEGEEIVDAIGSLITTLYRAKKATFSATNSLLSLDLAAAQYGATKEIASESNKIIDKTYEILTINEGKVTLAKAPKSEIKFIYSVESGNIGTCYKSGTEVSTTEFVYTAAEGENPAAIATPSGLTGKVYVEYEYETSDAIRIVNKKDSFPSVCSLVIYAYFKDKCNENITYSGKIICDKAKLNPEQVELALTSTGKHPFEFVMMNDYCEEDDADLFTIIVSNK